MIFRPMSPDEIRDATVLPAGIYPFRIKSAVEKRNAGGKPHIEIWLGISHGGREFKLRDYLSPEKMPKLYGACMTCGLGGQYVAGSLQAQDFRDRSGYVRVTLMPETSEYPARNFVDRYVPARVPERV
jgi:hypothetical protein